MKARCLATDGDRVRNISAVDGAASGLLPAATQEVRSTSAVRHVDSLSARRAALTESPFDLILLDLGLPDSAGRLHPLHVLRVAAPRSCIVVLTGDQDETLAIAALDDGADDLATEDTLDEPTVHAVVDRCTLSGCWWWPRASRRRSRTTCCTTLAATSVRFFGRPAPETT